MTTEPAKSETADTLDIPAFLRVENRKKKQDASTPGTSTKFMEDWELALSKVEPEEFRLFLTDMMRRGRFSRQWLVPNGIRRTEKDVKDTLEYWHEKLKESQTRVEEKKEKKRQKKDAASDGSAVIIFEGDNPKKAGTAPHKRWELLRTHDQKTVGAFLEAGGNATTLKNAMSSGYVTLEERKTEDEPGTEDGDLGRGDHQDKPQAEEGEVQARRRGGRRGIGRNSSKRKTKSRNAKGKK